MRVFSIDKSLYIDFREPVKPYRRLRQSLGEISLRIAHKIAADLKNEYDLRRVNPFVKNFKVIDWYHNRSLAQMITMNEAVELFLNEKKHYRSARTVEAYAEILYPFLRISNCADYLLMDVQKAEVEKYLYRSGISSVTANTYKRHLKAFFNWAIKKEFIEKNPVQDVPVMREKPNTANKMTPFSDVQKILEAYESYYQELIEKGQTARARGSRWFPLAVGLMLYAGLRRTDAITRKRKHLVQDCIIVEAIKGTSDRIVPILPELQVLIDEALQRISKSPEAYLLPSPINPDQHITGERVTRMFAMMRDRANLPKSRTSHGLRHSFVTEMLTRGLSTAEVKDLSGHSSVTVTEQYAHLVTKRLRDKMMGIG